MGPRRSRGSAPSVTRHRGRGFRRKFTPADVALLAETDALHGTLSGPANFVSPQARDEAETEKQLAEAELKEAIENQELAKLEYRRAMDQLKLRTLRSPFDAYVVDRLLHPGDLAESGTGRKPILKLAQINPLKVEVILPQAAYGRIKLGSSVTVVPEGFEGRYTAQVIVVDR